MLIRIREKLEDGCPVDSRERLMPPNLCNVRRENLGEIAHLVLRPFAK